MGTHKDTLGNGLREGLKSLPKRMVMSDNSIISREDFGYVLQGLLGLSNELGFLNGEHGEPYSTRQMAGMLGVRRDRLELCLKRAVLLRWMEVVTAHGRIWRYGELRGKPAERKWLAPYPMPAKVVATLNRQVMELKEARLTARRLSTNTEPLGPQPDGQPLPGIEIANGPVIRANGSGFVYEGRATPQRSALSQDNDLASSERRRPASPTEPVELVVNADEVTSPTEPGENDTTSPASRLVEEPLRGNTVPNDGQRPAQADAGEVVPSLHERYAIDKETGLIRLKKDGTPMLKRGPKLGDRKSESWKRALSQSAAGRRPPEEQIAKAVAALRDWTLNNPDLVAAAAAHARAVKAERRKT